MTWQVARNIAIILAAAFLFTIFPFFIPICFFKCRGRGRVAKPKAPKVWQPKIDKTARVYQGDAFWARMGL